MILYSYVDRACEEPRFYLTLGPSIMDGSLGQFNRTAFNPYLMETVKAFDLTQSTGRNSFLQYIGSFAPAEYREMYEDEGLPYFKYAIDVYPASADKRNELSILRDFLLNYFFPKYWHSYLSVYANSDDQEALDAAFEQWFNYFAQVLSMTFKKYCILINALKTKEDKLMEQLSSWSYGQSRFNDTPQNSGRFDDDAHTTNLTETDTKAASDFETPIKRIKEIRDNLEDYYNAWALDFDKLFVRIPQSL